MNLESIATFLFSTTFVVCVVASFFRDTRRPRVRTPKPRKVDSPLARLAAILATVPVVASLFLVLNICTGKGSACGYPGDDSFALVFFAAIPMFWAIPKFWRWFAGPEASEG